MAFIMKKKLSETGLEDKKPKARAMYAPTEATYKNDPNAFIANEVNVNKSLVTKGKGERDLGKNLQYSETVNPTPDFTEKELAESKPISDYNQESEWYNKYYGTPRKGVELDPAKKELYETLSKQSSDASGEQVTSETIRKMIDSTSDLRVFPGKSAEEGDASVKVKYDPNTGLYSNVGIGTSKNVLTGEENINEPWFTEELTHASNLDATQGRALQNFLFQNFDAFKGSGDSQVKDEDELSKVMYMTRGVNRPGDSRNIGTEARKYLSRPEESYGGYNQFRAKLGFKQGDKYTTESLQKAIDKNPEIKEDRWLKAFGVENAAKALNEIASTSKKADKLKSRSTRYTSRTA